MAGIFSGLLDTGTQAGGLGNALQGQQVDMEEERRKRLLQIQQQAALQPISSMFGVNRGMGSVSQAMSGGMLGSRR